MKNFEKYQRQYFMPPEVTYDWVKKEYRDPKGSYLVQRRFAGWQPGFD